MLPVVIVGGGTAGSVAAAALAGACDAPIVVVEPGARTDDDAPRFMDGLIDDVLWPDDPCPQARALGGGSAVNGMILSGAEPQWLAGLTRVARADEAGLVGRELLGVGGRLSRLWWNNGRWNPARAVLHLEEEGRLRVVRGAARQLVTGAGAVTSVVVDDGEIGCSHVVMCCGALRTPALLRASGLRGAVGDGLQNHPTVTFTVERPGADTGRFDATTVVDIDSDGAVGLVVGFERADAVDTANGLVTVSLMNPRSRGAAHDSVDFALVDDPWDRAAMARLVEHTSVLLSRTGLGVREVSGVHAVSHPASSCAGAVDALGRLSGVVNVTVADASVLPAVPHETPAASVTIVARRTALALGEALS